MRTRSTMGAGHPAKLKPGEKWYIVWYEYKGIRIRLGGHYSGTDPEVAKRRAAYWNLGLGQTEYLTAVEEAPRVVPDKKSVLLRLDRSLYESIEKAATAKNMTVKEFVTETLGDSAARMSGQ